jgi:hypothetical protein
MTLEQVKAAMGSLGLGHPPLDWVPITLDDNNDLSFVARAIQNRDTAAAVTLVVRTVGGGTTDRTVVIPAGHVLPGLFTRVKSTGSTGGATVSGAV